jgi:hypothetical protein
MVSLGVPLTTFGSVPSRLASLGASHPPTAAIPGTSRITLVLRSWPRESIYLQTLKCFLREPPGGPRSGGEAMSEAKPVRWRPERSEGHAQIVMKCLILDEYRDNKLKNSKIYENE